MQSTSSSRRGGKNNRREEAEERVADRPKRRWRRNTAAIRGTETRLGRTREYDVPRREKEASKSENDLSCRVRRNTEPSRDESR